MKKYIGFMVLVAFLLSFSTAFLAHAENSSGSNTGNTKDAWKEKKENFKNEREAFKEKAKSERKAFLDSMKAERDAFLAELKAKKEEWKSANQEKKKDFWEKSKKMIAQRFEGAVENLTKIQTKVGEIITKLNGLGKDTTLATEALNLSKSKLADAKTKVAEIKALLPVNTGETITAEVFEKIKVLAREARDLLKESREYLHESIKAVKDLRESDDNKEDDSSNDSN